MVSDRQTFGERLKRQRERRSVTLESISEATKIAAPLFAALERGDCSKWPAGLYGRAYVRAYAEAIGLNGDETVEDFAAIFNGTSTASERAAARSRRSGGALRLSLDEEPAVAPERVLRRVALAGSDLIIATTLACTTYLLLDAGTWLTLGSGLAYHFGARIVSDEPMVVWAYRRLRTSAAAERSAPAEDVAVGDAASTTA